MRVVEGSDIDDLDVVRLLFAQRRRRKIKFFWNQIDWDDHVKMFEHTGQFIQHYRMKAMWFDRLLHARSMS